MFPETIGKDVNAAEREVYKKLESGLGPEIVCYHNYEVGNMETDFIIMLPGKGIVILEVKGWDGTRITKILDKERIEYIDYNNQKQIDYSPLTQCKNYTYALRKRITRELDKNLKVIPIVCFPFMNEQLYKQKSMEIIVPRERVILKDDLEDVQQLYYVIKQKFDSKKVGPTDHFDEELYVTVSRWYEDKQTILNRLKSYKPERKVKRMFNKRSYSVLSHIKLEDNIELRNQQLEHFFQQWIIGTKIILALEHKQDIDKVMGFIEDKIKTEMNYLQKYKEFKVYDTDKRRFNHNIFHFEVYATEALESSAPFTIEDGKDYTRYHEVLQLLDQKTNFNYKQYSIEHASNEGNILIKAGAGTGKTYSMVSRISYLYYSRHYNPEDLLKAIIMITFTNEAADNMKSRLKKYFTNMAILTEETEYIHIMENISRMQISTIHALMKKIIQANSKYLGVGNQIQVTTEVYNRRQLIHQVIAECIKENDVYKALIGPIQKYELRKAIEKYMDMLEKKNINLAYDYTFDTVEEHKDLFDLIKEVATEVQKRSIDEHIRSNKVHLSNLSIYIDQILRALEERNIEVQAREKVDYVFVDEFQDTDDVTIDLIKRFYRRIQFNLFVVGDIKQSIYRFRGADDEAFTKLQDGVDNWVKGELQDEAYLTLNKNYRSDATLLSCFDKLFASWQEGVGKFEEILKYTEQDKLEGVKTNPLIKKHIQSVECTEATFETELVKVLDMKMKELEEKYQDKTDKKGTIAILTRDNKQIEEIRQMVMKYDKYTIETDKVENLYQMEPTRDLYRLVLALQYYTNAKCLYSLSLSNYAPTIVHKEVYKNRKDPMYIKKLFDEDCIIKHWKTYVNETGVVEEDKSILGSLKHKTILRVIRDINKQTKPWERYAAQFEASERQSRKVYYKRNQDLLLERIIQMSGENLTINKLAKYLHLMIFTNQHQDERTHKKKETNHIIKCLTVHKSKGLEYDHVIIPYTTNPLDKPAANELIVNEKGIFTQLIVKPKDDNKGEKGIRITSKHYHKNVPEEKKDLVKEEARILYVALTRAEDTVVWFNHQEEEQQKDKISWKELLDKGGEEDEAAH